MQWHQLFPQRTENFCISKIVAKKNLGRNQQKFHGLFPFDSVSIAANEVANCKSRVTWDGVFQHRRVSNNNRSFLFQIETSEVLTKSEFRCRGKSHWFPNFSSHYYVQFTLLASWVFKIRGCRKNSKNEKIVQDVQVQNDTQLISLSYFPPHFLPISLIDLSTALARASNLAIQGQETILIILTNCCTSIHDTITVRGGGAWPRCRSKKEDWQPKKDRTQRTPGSRRSQDGFVGTTESSCRGPVSNTPGPVVIQVLGEMISGREDW